MRKKQYKIFAAIHLGSEMISMQIVQYRNLNNMKVLEECNRRVRLGEETFKNKIIPFSMVNEICELLVGFKRLMTEYEVEEYSMQATTAVREALNRVFLLDQIYIRTGLKVTVIDRGKGRVEKRADTLSCADRRGIGTSAADDGR